MTGDKRKTRVQVSVAQVPSRPAGDLRLFRSSRQKAVERRKQFKEKVVLVRAEFPRSKDRSVGANLVFAPKGIHFGDP